MINYEDPSISLGQKIKYFRTLNKIKQADFAEGICSISYLSKVENDSLVPSEEIKKLLLEKLNINSNKVNLDMEFNELLIEWQKVLSENKIDEADFLLDKIQKQLSPSINKLLQLKYKIIMINHFILKREWKLAKEYIEKVTDFNIELNSALELKYYYNRYIGEFYYYQYKFSEALPYFIKCDNLTVFQSINNKEAAQLYYSIALSACRVDKFHTSISYGKKALEILQNTYNLKRCVECHMLLGIALNKIFNYDEALNQYEQAKTLAESIQAKRELYMINHNLGELYNYLEQPNKALACFNECHNNKQYSDSENHIKNIISIIEVHYKLEKFIEIKKWVNQGKTYILNQQTKDARATIDFNKYFGLLQLYEDLCLKNFNNIILKLHELIIPAFEAEQKMIELSNILKIVAEHEYQINKYKSAATLFSLSRDYLLKHIT